MNDQRPAQLLGPTDSSNKCAQAITEARIYFQIQNLPVRHSRKLPIAWLKREFICSSNTLIALEKLIQLVSRFGNAESAFYVASKTRLTAKVNLWKQSLPLVRPYYAIKCNHDPMLMRWLAEGGAGFDCASGMELQKAATLYEGKPNAFAEASIFANPCKPPRDLRLASQLGSGPTVVDSVEEVEKLASVGWQRGALIRIAVDDHGSKMPFSKKFGAAISDISKIKDAAQHMKQDIRGISFHVGSGCMEPLQYSKAIQMSLLCLQGLPNANIVDIGGGFESNPRNFIEAANFIQQSIQAVPPSLDIKWIAEPGRFMATDFQDLFVPVIGKKPTANGVGWRYTIDDSLYGQFTCVPFDRQTPKWLRVKKNIRESERKRVPGVLFGRTCDSVDMIAQSNSMEELEVGDWLWFPHMGAYTSVTATEFNGFPKPFVHYLEKESMPFVSFMAGHAWPENVKTVSSVLVPK